MKKIINKFKHLAGYHSGTNSLRKIFKYYGYEIDEEMIFGLASALDFNFTDIRQNQLPHIYGRVKPGNFEKNLSESLGIKIKVKETVSKKKAFEALFKMINSNNPMMIYTDVAYLPYLKIPDFYHFGVYSVVVFGYDDEQQIVYLSDCDTKGFKITMNPHEKPEDYHIVSYDNLILARSSKEKHQPPCNRWLFFNFKGWRDITPDIIKTAIIKNVNNMVGNNIKNIGIEGIELFSQKVLSWKLLEDNILHKAAYDAFTMIDKVGSTGGGCHRKIYGNFLRTAGDFTGDEFLCKCGAEFLKTADIWDDVAAGFHKVLTLLQREELSLISSKLLTIALREQELLLRLKEHLEKN
jgi:hypothetical protein